MNESFGSRMRSMRHARHWSQQELSLRSGISTPHISSIERDKRHPSLEYAQRIACALGVSLTLLCDERSDFMVPNMHNSPDELPLYMQNFILNESAYPYLEAAQRMSTLPKEDASFLTKLIELLAQRHRLVITYGPEVQTS
ncbi:helix-turn-helix domain-containing protein [Alicyclobacillus dauci]|uniref:Helix-turn-helix transcriptional regulator n=1 Tax=Alicyclobacillus dauci TaxID=1475485 RepID=A0ABY6Z884_9BACL|nr:helix-turn-helix transcriptional regulator [Alicyclobacillus dauci]WAH39079.1 helix-turn-helix transcriptional regulator [Alicyclobacillus dauci]